MLAGVGEHHVVVQIAGPGVGLRDGHGNDPPQQPPVVRLHQEAAAAVPIARAGTVPESY